MFRTRSVNFFNADMNLPPPKHALTKTKNIEQILLIPSDAAQT